MSEELMIYEGKQAVVKTKGLNYKLTSPMTGAVVTLNRDVDFGMIPKAKKPSLFKSGAEKVIAAYGLLQHYTIESKIENVGEDPFFMYTIRCDLVRVSNEGKEYIFTSGIGSANTKESRNGFAGAFNAANTALKMAQKRSMVSAAVNIGGLSDMFTMDVEDSDFTEKGYQEIAKTQNPDAKLTSAQAKRLFAIANHNGINANKAKDRLAILGYNHATDITQNVYDEVCELLAMEDAEFNEKVKER